RYRMHGSWRESWQNDDALPRRPPRAAGVMEAHAHAYMGLQPSHRREEDPAPHQNPNRAADYTPPSNNPGTSPAAMCVSAAPSATSTCIRNPTYRADVLDLLVRCAISGSSGCEVPPCISVGFATSETRTAGVSPGTPMPTRSTNRAF